MMVQRVIDYLLDTILLSLDVVHVGAEPISGVFMNFLPRRLEMLSWIDLDTLRAIQVREVVLVANSVEHIVNVLLFNTYAHSALVMVST